MDLEDFYRDLPAIWLVFAGSYLNHGNAPQTLPNQCEKSLVDLLRSYLNIELVSSITRQQYDAPTLTQLTAVCNLLKVWSNDLDLIYQIRGSSPHHESQLRQVAQRFLQRVRTFEDCMVIPNGLISAGHTERHENINLAILKKHVSRIDWIQVNPGGAYHQRCSSFAGEKSNAYLEITGINPHDITEDWLYLLVGLKAARPNGDFHYKEASLYECLLAHLNGKTVFQSQPDEGFVFYSHTSPAHTWQVVEQSFRYLLQHFLGETYLVVYRRLLTGFKLFLMEKTFAAYQDGANKKIQQCHYLLQEMCRHVAQQALDQGNQEQIAASLTLIDVVKAAIEQRCSQQEQQVCRKSQLNEPHVLSLNFVAPRLIHYTHSSSSLTMSSLQADPIFINPGIQGDIIDYLKRLKQDFIDKLVDSTQLKEVVLLSYGIEVFFIDYLAKTDILQRSALSFSKDDTYLANTLKELAEIYYSCQGRLVGHFLSGTIYQPQFYAKNVAIQFFVYAAVAALALRDKNIGPLLATYNLSTATSKSFKLNKIVPHLVIDDVRYLKILLAVQAFFAPEKDRKTLFSYKRFNSSQFTFVIDNDAEENNIDVAFAYQLLQKYNKAYRRFARDYRDLEDEKLNQKWKSLTYSDNYLPPLYDLLFKVALFAKASLTGFPSSTNRNRITICWSFGGSDYWRSIVSFQINGSRVSINPDSNQLASYLIKSDSWYAKDPYQRFIIHKENICKANNHFLENEIIASQDEKPAAMDCIRYMHLGFLQSEPRLKLERLYIAIKERQLDFSCKQESILIKQTLFEISILMEAESGFCSLVEWAVQSNPLLIHKLGLLCVKKALAMKYRMTQHPVIGEILEVVLGLLTFYPTEYKNEFIDGIADIYFLLKAILAQPPAHLSDNTLLYLNAYSIISIQAKPQLIETETLTLLTALLAIQNYKVKGIWLDNNLLRRMYLASFTLTALIEHQLEQYPTLLNDLMLSVIPQWDQASSWQKNQAGLLFTCGDYAIKPLLGVIYFQNQPITGLPDTITEHRVFKEYLGKVSFAVIPASREMNAQEVSCYLSVDREPQIRLTLIANALLIEEWIEGDYQRYIPAQELLGYSQYPRLFYELSDNKEILRHWLDDSNKVLIKNQQRQIIYQWDLQRNTVFSLQHQGYVVPWEQLQASYFKTWLERIELSEWIEIIAQQASASSVINIQSLHFPRLGLHFDYRQGTFFSRQIHRYYLAEQQHLNTLQGFSNYLILKKKAKNLMHQLTKVIIPHRKITPRGPFYTKTTGAHLDTTRYPSYFVYDLDQKTGLLKAKDISAQLYLALLYYCSASLDNNDVSHCNAYHLARENLEVCWKDQPYDKVELDIIEQLLGLATVRDFHSYRVALYLKVVSLLSSSLRLAFLYTDKAALQNKKRSEQLLNQCRQWHPHFLTIYLQNKPTIFARIRLSSKEEQDVIKQFSVSSSRDAKKSYKNHYQQLFAKQALDNTNFLGIFQRHIYCLNFSYDTKGLNFSSGINGIVIDRFRLMHFITLYKLAKSSAITITKYRYLLHHVVLRAAINYHNFPLELVMMLARTLLLVAENPGQFPKAPIWFDSSDLSVDLSKRCLTQTEVYNALPSFIWTRKRPYDTRDEAKKAEENARREDERENERIWSYFARYDLNSQGVPLLLPDNSGYFTLKYESYVNFSDVNKRAIVRRLYLTAARNDAMYQFFVRVLQQCDQLKYASTMGWVIVPFIHNAIPKITKTDELPSLPTLEPIDLEGWASFQQPLIDLAQFFIVKQQPIKNNNFLFEAQLKEPTNGYQKQFYSELKDSWVAYHNETVLNYSWLNAHSMNELEGYLQVKHTEIREHAERIWDSIAVQFKRRPNSESDHYFALRWYSGQVPHYHKGDLLTLLVEPHKLAMYNPACLQERDLIIQGLLSYVNAEINAAKIVRVLACIEQYKQVESEPEQFSLLQCLVRNLQENLDPVSYRYPHWLLFQLENDVIVRDNQRELIVAMLSQTEKAMYQLNMGEGKSSVILPLLSYNLANGQQLLRINVLSSLLITMKNFLRQRFSYLIRKRVYTLPFYRDTDISTNHLTLILQTLKTCQLYQHILLVTPEHRLCLQLKHRELMLENQQQIGATNIFNWQTYRQRVVRKVEVYQDLTEEETERLLVRQDQRLKTCLYNEQYIDSNNRILKVPPRGQGRREFARFKEIINDSTFREWSCLKAAYRELLYNSTLAYRDSSEKLALLNKIGALTAIDLLDESDEILRHGTELNYTMGDKYVFAGGELRWKIPQFFIGAIFCDPALRDIITAGEVDSFTEINVNYTPRGGVPFIQLINESYYENHIKPVLIEKFFSEHLPTLRKYHVNVDDSFVKGEASSLRRYIAGQLPLSIEKKVLAFLADKGPLKDKVLIAKGWLSHGILFHVLNAKYRVQYGLNLHVKSQMPKQIAIPFLGKDVPSPRSEFSHPDVMLGFTIISYLYQGLNQQQLKETLLRLKNKFSHHVADTHLRAWAEASRAWIETQTEVFPPLLLMSLEHIDLADEQCLVKVHEYLSGNHPAIFFYLNEFVFLEEAMQYRTKISANAHSLVGYDAALGFSGTDDRKLTMPFQIKSLRSTTQQGTNGKLLSVLTQERNRRYYSLQTDDTADLLKQLCHYVEEQPHCHALIDGGALVTGLTNYEVAEFLLANLPHTFLGILYFSDEGNNLTVLTRDNKTIALQDCYLDKQYLFAYLDDVHTRGTDIQLPLNCQAILTISMGMQKDKLMQAAMRLRQLAQKQSVSLWGTKAVTLTIAKDNRIDATRINSLEVIKWVTHNTIEHINADLFPVALRKINFQFLQKAEAWLKEAPTTLDTLIQYCQEKELFFLEEFYALSPQREDLCDRLYWLVAAKIRIFWQDLEQELISKQLTSTDFYKKIVDQSAKYAFRERLDTICKELAVYLQVGYVHNSLDNDQEKEVEVEIIQEQQVVVKVEKREASLEKTWDVRLILQKDFVTFAEQQGIIMPLNAIRHFIQLPANLKNIIWHPDIYMTANFINSVQSTLKETLDNYLRPVDVVLIHRFGDKSRAVLLSGQEAAKIKSTCYSELTNNLLVHVNDIDGPTQLPIGSTVSKQEQKLFTLIKLFSGECHYSSSREVQRLAKRVGRIYPHYFTSPGVTIGSDCSEKIYGILIEKGYLDFAGIMTEKLLRIFAQIKAGELPTLELTSEYQSYSQHLLKKLYGIYNKLIIQPSSSFSLKESHHTLWQWVGTRGRLKDYPGSELESIVNSEYQLKC